jgi:hypothetical protein
MCPPDDDDTSDCGDSGNSGGLTGDCPVMVCADLGFGITQDQSTSNWYTYSFGDWTFGASFSSTYQSDPFSQSYPNDGSILSQIMNNPTLASNWTTTFNSAYSWVKAGTIWEGSLTGIAFGAPAIAAAGSAVYGTTVNLAARGVGWYYGTFGAGTGVVLGRFNTLTNYVQAAKSIGANALNSPRAYNFFSQAGQWWTLNRAFLNASIARGQQFFMSGPVLGNEGSYFAQELEYLVSRGIGPSQWQMVRLPY